MVIVGNSIDPSGWDGMDTDAIDENIDLVVIVDDGIGSSWNGIARTTGLDFWFFGRSSFVEESFVRNVCYHLYCTIDCLLTRPS
mmetsp:Transcript_47404/g.115642  ORF Transcript_47404/g.115642 Transcript_47404/m.115642 type:complete len:84 (+) Transcript_47404:247-498(+)